MTDSRIEKAKRLVSLAHKPAPRYVYKQSTGRTYFVKIKGVYIGTFATIDAAEAAVAKVFADD